ncbi:STAS domain-containing protein [Saccharothrix longispora]|uniref:Anti-sigma factor antagonist n=1 Tax=Saccharothrix longispora TaxID=33920 RepID=A0ABU1PUU0_9PSEU|nr:STAS domain-containing protein [Saccharothrix longispora]MDR6594390.1 anti-anti-sigma factor [Saccharothrix longispora]
MESVAVGDIQVVRVTGEIDLATGDLVWSELLLWLDDAGSALVADLTGVTFMAAAGVHLLLDVAHNAGHRGVRFVLVAGDNTALSTLYLTGVDSAIPVHPDLDHAIAVLRQAAVHPVRAPADTAEHRRGPHRHRGRAG